MKYSQLRLTIACLLILFFNSPAQPGKDGPLTVSSTQVLNRYSPVVVNVPAGSTSVQVMAESYLLGLCPGDLILIYQAQGANINTTNTSGYGSVLAYNSAGLYEFSYVQSVNLNTINLVSALTNSYAVSGMAQVVKVPQYTSLTVNAGAIVNPRPWHDSVVSTIRYRFGGITAIHAASIVNNGTITATGFGFRGGQLDITNTAAYSAGSTVYVSNVNSMGGEKGESIAGYQPEYDLQNGRYGRGAPANGGGGGGGDGWNAGGGGGANGDNTNTWTGQGVMVVNSTNPLSAWALDPGYIAAGSSLTNSSGGGRGGYSLGFTPNNPSTTGPGNSAWGGDSRREVGGLGGRPLTNINFSDRIYFGGGGGAGDENNANGGPGGTGGGIVYLIATSGISGSGLISANGNNGFNTTGNGWDAPGGAGGGGSVIVKTAALASTQNVSVSGGNGGNQFVSTSECEGPGGGGGGGFAGLSSAVPAPVLSGGSGGTSNSSVVSMGFNFYGSTYGASGQSAIISNTFIPYALTVITATNNSVVCEGTVLSFSATLISGAYSWTGPGGFSSILQNPSIIPAGLANAGAYTVNVSIPGCPSSYSAVTNVTVDPSPTLAVTGVPVSICPGQTATLTASGAISYTWMPGNMNGSNAFVSPSVTTTYTVTGSNASGCQSSVAITVPVGTSGNISITAPSTTICIGESVTLTASGASSYTWMPGNVISNTITVSPQTSQSYTVMSSMSTCTAQASQLISVNLLPTITVNSSSPVICIGGTVSLTASGASTYTWFPGSTNGSSLVVSPISSQEYTVVGGPGTCTSLAVAQVSVVTSIAIGLSNTAFSLCAGQPAVINVSGAPYYNVQPSVSDQSSGSFTIVPQHDMIYTVTASSGSCSDTKTLSVHVSYVNADFTDDATHATIFDPVNFQNLSSNNVENYWYFSNGSMSGEVNPVLNISDPGTYVACLLVKNDLGCMDTLCKAITIECPDDMLYIPNTFTPNDDGLNDVFRVVTLGPCIQKFSMDIFDRWGERIFASDDLARGWNGKIKGQLVQDDVYVYLVEYTMSNGKSHKKSGHVTLMK